MTTRYVLFYKGYSLEGEQTWTEHCVTSATCVNEACVRLYAEFYGEFDSEEGVIRFAQDLEKGNRRLEAVSRECEEVWFTPEVAEVRTMCQEEEKERVYFDLS